MPDNVQRKKPIEAEVRKPDKPEPEADPATPLRPAPPRRPVDQAVDADDDDLFNDMPV